MRFLLLVVPLLLTAAFVVQARGQATLSDMREAGLVVGNLMFDSNDGVLRYDGLGTFIDKMIAVPDAASGLIAPCCLTFGPDENLYLSNPPGGTVLRFNGVTGEFIDTFVPIGSGGLVFPLILVFHDGYLFVGDTGTGAIRRYDAKTGAPVDTFIPDNSHGMGVFGDLQSFAFGPDGNLYVLSQIDNRVLRYNGHTGAFIDEFVPGNAGLDQPAGVTFGANGMLYVASNGSGEVRRYDIHTGSYEVFIPGGGTLAGPVGIAFGPDGNFYATSIGSSAILQYDGKTGAYLGMLVQTGSGGISGPRTLEFKSKTTVCHMAGGNLAKGKTLSIGYWSARDHLRHGDTLGKCK